MTKLKTKAQLERQANQLWVKYLAVQDQLREIRITESKGYLSGDTWIPEAPLGAKIYEGPWQAAMKAGALYLMWNGRKCPVTAKGVNLDPSD